MLLVDRNSDTTTPCGGDANIALLRFRADGRLVELPVGKTTIGSSPRCSLQIERPGVAPVHCLIVRDADGLSVRRWAVDTRLNGMPFDEAPLTVGNCLDLAGVELEVVDTQPMVETQLPIEEEAADIGDISMRAEQQPTEESVESNAADTESEFAPVEPNRELEPASDLNTSPSVSETVEIVFRQLQAACGVSRGRNWKFLAALREQRNQNHELAERLAHACDELADLNRERVDWEQTRHESAGAQSELESQLQGLRQEVIELEGRLADQTRQTTELRLELTNAQANEPPVAAAMQGSLPAAASEESPSFDWGGANGRPARTWSVVASDSPADRVVPSISIPQVTDEGAGGEVSSLAVAPCDVDSPIEEFSVWKASDAKNQSDTGETDVERSDEVTEPKASWDSETSGAESCERAWKDSPAPVEEPAFAASPWESSTAAAEIDGPEAAPTQLPPTSHIERFSDKFAEEPADEPLPAGPARPLFGESDGSRPCAMDVNRSEHGSEPAAANNDEESIEQYMAKLLQRVRGELPAGATQPAAAKAEEAATLTAALPQSAPSAIETDEEEDDVEVSVNWEAIARRAAASTTDLGPLRALANESARSAISRHGLKKHRRDAVTKVIVSTLAGMTSLWLMLDAPNWRHIQFVAACVLLIVAAYWAGDACRVLLESRRAAAYGGPNADRAAAEVSGPSALPIDVELRR